MKKNNSILVVDDNISLCKTMSFVLRRKVYVVTTARDRPEVIEKVRATPFDLIFMDIKLPQMNGVETYKRLKKIRPEAVILIKTIHLH
jgi:CheY-like chemotaxis protein